MRETKEKIDKQADIVKKVLELNNAIDKITIERRMLLNERYSLIQDLNRVS